VDLRKMFSMGSRSRSRSRFCPLLAWLIIIALTWAAVASAASTNPTRANSKLPSPNVLVVIADQWRFDAFGYAGNPDVRTPNLDRLARESARFVNAVSTCPVCSPMRASFLTGQRPLTHGVFLNDVLLDPNATTISKVLKDAGYDTGYIGKWHLNGNGRSEFIPRDRRQGFDYWKVLECTHDYNRSFYYADEPTKLQWDGYDAIAQTRDAQNFLRARGGSKKPFFMVLAWGPPHDPYLTAPEKYRALYDPGKLTLRPNVPAQESANTRKILAGYYAHCTALDDCLGDLRRTLDETGLAANTLIIFTSDHGDMLGSHGMYRKQRPYDESIRVPLLIYEPAKSAMARSSSSARRNAASTSRDLETPVGSEDLMPTILGLCGVAVPRTVEGLDFSGPIRGGKAPGDGAATIMCVAPFGEWTRKNGGKEYRGIRTSRHTYVRDLNGPWLLFDNQADPYQTNNLAGLESSATLQKQMERQLATKLERQRDKFLSAGQYIEKWGYKVDANGTVPYEK